MNERNNRRFRGDSRFVIENVEAWRKRYTRKKRTSPKGKRFQKGQRVGGPVRGRKKSPAERRVVSRRIGLRRCGVFRRSLILYRCHREEYAYSWDTPRLINVGLLVIRLKCAFLERCFKRNTRPVTPPGRSVHTSCTRASISRIRDFILAAARGFIYRKK